MSRARGGGWTRPEHITAKVRRRWEEGSLLRAYARAEPFPEITIPLRGPTAAEAGDDLFAARAWVAELDAGRREDSRYRLEWTAIGGRHLGRNQVPSKAIVSSYPQAWALLGVAGRVRRFDEILALTAPHPSARDWAVLNPHRALELHIELPRLLAAYQWLDENRGSSRYLREIAAPGVDTKFAEKHRSVLAAMIGVPGSASGFVAGLGLRTKPEFVRIRFGVGSGLPTQLTELAVRSDELARLDVSPHTALVVENEVSYLSVPVPHDGIALWGKGFEVDRVGRLPWLATADILYWGDLDTHGFAILDRLRAWLPHTRSVLMDRDTLLAHRDRWVTEERPATSWLRHLTKPEADLYADLVSDRLGERVRLEQERVDWSWVTERLNPLLSVSTRRAEEGRHHAGN